MFTVAIPVMVTSPAKSGLSSEVVGIVRFSVPSPKLSFSTSPVTKSLVGSPMFTPGISTVATPGELNTVMATVAV